MGTRQRTAILVALVMASNLGACANSKDPAPPADSAEPPLLEKWEANMRKWGRHWGEYLSQPTLSDNERLNAVYYDGGRIYYQIADYTGEAQPWTDYARRAEAVYLDKYAKPNQFKTSGYWRFPHGLYRSWQENPSPDRRKALVAIRDKPAFSDIDARDPEKWHRVRYSREIAYAINAHITALKADIGGREKALSLYVAAALDHLEIWRTGKFRHPEEKWHLRQPFMFALTGEALIDYVEYRREAGDADPRILPELTATADWFWENMWVSDVDGRGHGAFYYMNRNREGIGHRKPAPDLNLLIAPVYAWLYKETGERTYRERADAIFAGGVALACLECSAKIFNQNYRLSFDYLTWRRLGDRRRHGKSRSAQQR